MNKSKLKHTIKQLLQEQTDQINVYKGTTDPPPSPPPSPGPSKLVPSKGPANPYFEINDAIWRVTEIKSFNPNNTANNLQGGVCNFSQTGPWSGTQPPSTDEPIRYTGDQTFTTTSPSINVNPSAQISEAQNLINKSKLLRKRFKKILKK